jgi:hypothetical protein
MKQGIPEKDVVRLGSKPSPSTQSMALSTQASAYQFDSSDWEHINEMKSLLKCDADPLRCAFSSFNKQLGPSELLDHLESRYPAYFKALSVPPADDDMILIGESGRAIGHTYLISRWLNDQDAGVLRDHPTVTASQHIWGLPTEERKTLEARWDDEILERQIEDILEAGLEYDISQTPLNAKFQQRTRHVLSSKRIIACTTTGAAIFRDAIQSAGPEILMVEEAGEVQECHVLTALSRSTKQMILIGDHKCVVISLPS